MNKECFSNWLGLLIFIHQKFVFLSMQVFHFLVKSIPRYFIIFSATINGKFFLDHFDYLLEIQFIFVYFSFACCC